MRRAYCRLLSECPGRAYISGMLASRGYNIDSLAVGETEDSHLSRMTFVVVGDDACWSRFASSWRRS
jgi:acetolactate synthase-1/3 small subunit